MTRLLGRTLVAAWCVVGVVPLAFAQSASSLIDATKRLDVATVRTLLATRTAVNAAEADGFTALHWAAQRNSLELVNLLLAARANAKATTRYNITPLYLAALNGSTTVMERLL